MIFVDTGAWFAAVVPTDPDHTSAEAWLSSNRDLLLTTDFIIDETLTLLRARGERRRALELGQNFFDGNIALVHHLTAVEVASAWEVFRKFDDKNWSFTDCTSKVVIESLGIAKAFAFDKHFSQFASAKIVP